MKESPVCLSVNLRQRESLVKMKESKRKKTEKGERSTSVRKVLEKKKERKEKEREEGEKEIIQERFGSLVDSI